MKWYIASRTKHREKLNKLINSLESHGEEISYNWSNQDIFSKDEYEQKASFMADDINKALQNTDIFILVSDKEGTDMFVELGMALHQSLYNDKLRIYIVGEYNTRSLMHFHPRVERVNNIQDVFSKELPDFLNEILL